MAGVPAGAHRAASARTPGPRRAAGICGTIITAAVGDHVPTLPLAVSIVVTLPVCWLAEEYAEILGGQLQAAACRHGEMSAPGWQPAGRWSAPPAFRCCRSCWPDCSGHPPDAANAGLVTAIVLLMIPLKDAVLIHLH